MSLAAASTTDGALRQIEERVLWLATAIVDHAHRVRPNPSGLKVGGQPGVERVDGHPGDARRN